MSNISNVYEYGPEATAAYDPEFIRKLETALSTLAPETEFLLEDGDTIRLPKAAVEILRVIVHSLARGQTLTLIAGDKELTTQAAADILNVSRPFLVKLLDEGEIPYTKTGTHRRVRFSDLMAYKKKRDERRREALNRLSDLDQESGLEG